MPGSHNEIAYVIGERIKELRGERGISQEEMSYRCGLHRTEISQLERGLRVPRIDTLIKIASSLEVRLEDLAGQLAWRPGEYQAGTFTVAPVERGDDPRGGESR